MQRPAHTFLRSSIGDSAAWKQQMEALRASVERAQGPLALAIAMGRLGDHLRLSPDHREEAIAMLRDASMHAEDAGDPGTLAANRIRLAIAQQYAGDHRTAIELHRSAIDLIHAHTVAGLIDFALQHLGKCHAEIGEIEEAAACFEQALRLREERGEGDLINSTRKAIAHLQHLRTSLTDT